MSRNRRRNPPGRGRGPAIGQPLPETPPSGAVKVIAAEPHTATQSLADPGPHDRVADRAAAADAIYARYFDRISRAGERASAARRQAAVDHDCELEAAWQARCAELGRLQGRIIDPDPIPDPDPGPVPGDDADEDDDDDQADEPDPGDEVDDEGGASEFRYLDPDPDGYQPPSM